MEAYELGSTHLKFQFTLPRGERLLLLLPSDSSYCFNSRSREGSDKLRRFRPP